MKTLTLAVLSLFPAALAAQGNFQDRVVWDRLVRFVQDYSYVDDDGDGVAALFAAAPGPATIHRFDENGGRTDFRGPTGVNYGHEFVVGAIFGGPRTLAVASRSGSVNRIDFLDSKSGAGTAPGVTIPAQYGNLTDLQLANLDADPEREVVVVCSAALAYYDGGTQTLAPIRTAPAGTFGPLSLVRPRAGGPDTVIVPTATSPVEVREYDVTGGHTVLGTLPAPLVAQVDAMALVGGEPMVSTSNGSITTPDGRIWLLDPLQSTFVPRVTGQPVDSFPRVVSPNAIGRWRYVKRTFGGNEELWAADGAGAPRLEIRAPAGTALDVDPSGERDMFPGNTPHLLVRQAASSLFSAYQTSGPVDTRITGGGAASGSSFQADAVLGGPGAGALVFPVLSLQAPATTTVPGIGPISFVPDALTLPSTSYLGGPALADANGLATFHMQVPPATNGWFRFDVSFGWIAFRNGGAVTTNQTGAFTYVDVQ